MSVASPSRLDRQLAFLGEADSLKTIERQSLIADCSRRENSAEHSWHLALFALVLAGDHAELDLSKVIAMLLIHDIVEIDAGDVPIHGDHDTEAQQRREEAAAARLFGLLPDDQAGQLLALWKEFELADAPEARFAKALDRFQPLLLNTLTRGGTWAESKVTQSQVIERYGPTIRRGSPDLWEYARGLVEQHFGTYSAAD
jgi:putative hydrolase of HD superfamily